LYFDKLKEEVLSELAELMAELPIDSRLSYLRDINVPVMAELKERVFISYQLIHNDSNIPKIYWLIIRFL
jgi:hypothetical protein